MVYFRNIKRLYRLIDEEGGIPLNDDWLKKKSLIDKYKNLPLKTRRHLSIAAVKALQTLGKNADSWTVRMYKDSAAYDRQRSKNKKSPEEKASWPKGGMKAVSKAAKEQWKRVKLLLKAEPSLKTLYKYSLFIILKLFTQIPFRNLFASFELKKTETGNYIEQPKTGNFTFVVNQHKTSKSQGAKKVKLSRALTMALRKYLKYRNSLDIKHDFLLSTKTGSKMTKAALGKAVHRVTKELLGGKGFGSRMIRILTATELKPEFEKISELQNKMLHKEGSKETKEYTRN